MKIPEPQNTTSQAIVKWYEAKPQEHRPHMGASIIGHDCPRYVWLTWRWARQPEFPGRILRLFSTGNREEPRFIEELRGIGATVWDRDESGQQFTVRALDGHFGGSLDGIAKGVPEAPKTACVLEFKTHNHKSFLTLGNKGVQEAKPQHYAQMQIYMHLMQLDRALYLAADKDTDEVYSEWVHLDKSAAERLLARAQSLIEATSPPERISDDRNSRACKYCSFQAHCHGDIAAQSNCRTCCHSTPAEEGSWRCESKRVTLSHEDQLSGCALHLMIPALVTYATAIDGGEGWIQYKHNTLDVEFINGQMQESDTAVFSSRELEHSPASLMPQVAATKVAFDGVVDPLADFTDDLEPVYGPGAAAKQEAKRTKIRQSARAMKGAS